MLVSNLSTMSRTGRLETIVHDGMLARSEESSQLLHSEGLLAHTHRNSDLLLHTKVGDKQVLLHRSRSGHRGFLLGGRLVN